MWNQNDRFLRSNSTQIARVSGKRSKLLTVDNRGNIEGALTATLSRYVLSATMPLKYIQLAKSSIKLFADLDGDPLVFDSRRAVDCIDCEAVIASGIHAFRVLEETDIVLRNAIYNGKLAAEYPDFDLDACMLELVQLWLTPIAHVEDWAKRCLSNGYTVEGIEDLQRCVMQANGIVKFLSGQEAPVDLRDAIETALEEHRSGKTSESVSEAE